MRARSASSVLPSEGSVQAHHGHVQGSKLLLNHLFYRGGRVQDAISPKGDVVNIYMLLFFRCGEKTIHLSDKLELHALGVLERPDTLIAHRDFQIGPEVAWARPLLPHELHRLRRLFPAETKIYTSKPLNLSYDVRIQSRIHSGRTQHDQLVCFMAFFVVLFPPLYSL